MRRHPLDLTSLLCGLVFLGVGVVYLGSEFAGEDVDVSLALPVTLIALGLAVVVGGIDRARRKPVEEAAPPDAATVDKPAEGASSAETPAEGASTDPA